MQQLQAVIDNRTTMVCLRAAGQIVPVGQPFDTLMGDLESPPFHVHCRSIVVPWMPGFVSPVRADANAEIALRPPKEKRFGPDGYGGRLPPPPSGPGIGPVTGVGSGPGPLPSVVRLKDVIAADDIPALKTRVEQALSTASLPEGVNTRVLAKKGYGNTVEVAIRIYDAEGNKIGSATRIMSDDGLPMVTHDVFGIEKEWQGKGIATAVNRQMEEVYHAYGLQAIELHANMDVGGYAWARAGYDWHPDMTSTDNVRSVLNHVRKYALIEGDTAAQEAVDQMIAGLEGPRSTWVTPFEVSQVGWREGASWWPGKAGMKESSWQGWKDL